MKSNVVFSRKSDEWETPQAFYNELNKEFNFTLDPCATDYNHKCESYFTKEQNGLNQSWRGQRRSKGMMCNHEANYAVQCSQ
mgnify:CR=1 FL=1